jgi:outer membrane protein TolC
MLGMTLCLFSIRAGAEGLAGPSLTVGECVRIALEKYPSLKGAQAEVEAAHQRVWQQAAGYLPRGGYAYDFNRQERPLTAILGGGQAGEVQRRETYLNVRQAEESIFASKTALKEATENLEMAEGRYCAGVGGIIELTQAEVLLSTAQANHVQALATYKTSLAQLEKATGVELTPEEERE